jgi:predicted lipoprotein with Yx(FWY)xxD motif
MTQDDTVQRTENAMSMHLSISASRLTGAAGVLAAGLLLAACGGGSDAGGSGSGSSPGSTQAAQKAGGQDVRTGDTEYGDVLVDASGKTLYVFDADSKGTSNCDASCLQYWPAAKASGTVTHSSDVTAQLSTITRDDGTTQLTVNGWPAYTYAADSGPGKATGQGTNLSGGLWWVVSPSGSKITKTDDDDSGGGYGGY